MKIPPQESKLEKNAGMAVVGVANTYPLHLLQRQANWCVDNLMQLDLDWINDTMKANFTL